MCVRLPKWDDILFKRRCAICALNCSPKSTASWTARRCGSDASTIPVHNSSAMTSDGISGLAETMSAKLLVGTSGGESHGLAFISTNRADVVGSLYQCVVSAGRDGKRMGCQCCHRSLQNTFCLLLYAPLMINIYPESWLQCLSWIFGVDTAGH